MGKYKSLVRCQLIMGRSITDEDRNALNCYYETPVFHVNSNYKDAEIIGKAYELFCAGNHEFRCTESVELIRVA